VSSCVCPFVTPDAMAAESLQRSKRVNFPPTVNGYHGSGISFPGLWFGNLLRLFYEGDQRGAVMSHLSPPCSLTSFKSVPVWLFCSATSQHDLVVNRSGSYHDQCKDALTSVHEFGISCKERRLMLGGVQSGHRYRLGIS
jgi:hypothetical protein